MQHISTYSSTLLKIDLKYMGQNIFSIFVLNDHNSILKLELNTVSYRKRTVELDDFTIINSKNYYPITIIWNQECGFEYRKVASTSLSHLEAHDSFFRWSMKGKFDVYFLWLFGKNGSPYHKHALILTTLRYLRSIWSGVTRFSTIQRMFLQWRLKSCTVLVGISVACTAV